MANTKISALTANTNPTGSEEFVYAYNNANGKITLDTMKTFVWWAGVTTLSADANIWELNEGTYVTTYDLYYKSGNKVPFYDSTWATKKQMLFVTKESTGEIGYLVFNVNHKNTAYRGYASYGYSISSSEWVCNQLWDREWALQQFKPSEVPGSIDALWSEPTQIASNVSWTQNLAISQSTTPYPWVTYTIYIDSASSAYTIWLWNGVTNPLGITLPSSTTKKCVITVLITSTTTWIVTGCTVEP